MLSNIDKYGVTVLMYEFLISVIVLLGGGALLFIDKSPEANAIAVSAITAAITFWFSRRQAESTARMVQQAGQPDSPVQPIIVQAAPPAPVPPAAPAAPAAPNPVPADNNTNTHA